MNENELLTDSDIQKKYEHRVKILFIPLAILLFSLLCLGLLMSLSGEGGGVFMFPFVIGSLLTFILSIFTIIFSINYFRKFGNRGLVSWAFAISLLVILVFAFYVFYVILPLFGEATGIESSLYS